MLHYIDTSQVLKFTGLSRSTLDRAKAKKEIKYFKKGRRCLYKLEDVRNWIEGDAPICLLGCNIIISCVSIRINS